MNARLRLANPAGRAEPRLVDLAGAAGHRVVDGLLHLLLAGRAAVLRARARRALARREGPLKLCLGSGAAPIPGWINVDLDRRADVRLDLRFPLPLPDASAALIYSEHVIEHLALEDGLRLLKECRRVLAPGGRMRIATPDLARVVLDYPQTWRGHDFLNWPEYAWVDSPARLVNLALRGWGHLYLYDFEELRLRLHQAGFGEVARCELGSSSLPDLLELETRIDSTLVVEATVAQ